MRTLVTVPKAMLLLVLFGSSSAVVGCQDDTTTTTTASGGAGSTSTGTTTSSSSSSQSVASATSSGTGAGCADVAGFYLPTAAAQCSVGAVPKGLCVTQSGCDVVAATNNVFYTGSVSGTLVSMSAMVMGLSVTCEGDVDGAGSGTLLCGVGSATVCTIPVERQTLPSNASNACCDPSVSPSPCMAGEKCGLVFPTGEDSVSATACVPEGAKTVGAACTLAADGTDDCKSGLVCKQIHSSDPECAVSCTEPGDCAAGEACKWTSVSAPENGSCVGSCSFTQSCPASTDCKVQNIINADTSISVAQVCLGFGASVEGDACVSVLECGAGLSCVSSVCRPLCDGTHPCAQGKNCTLFTGSTLGFCQ